MVPILSPSLGRVSAKQHSQTMLGASLTTQRGTSSQIFTLAEEALEGINYIFSFEYLNIEENEGSTKLEDG